MRNFDYRTDKLGFQTKAPESTVEALHLLGLCREQHALRVQELDEQDAFINVALKRYEQENKALNAELQSNKKQTIIIILLILDGEMLKLNFMDIWKDIKKQQII